MEETEIDQKTGQEREEDVLFNVDDFQRRVTSSTQIALEDHQRQTSGIKHNDLPPPVKPGPLDEFEIQAPCTFLSTDQHSSVSPADLSKRWGLSVAQAALTLKAATRRLLRSALMPLARRCRADRMFEPCRLQGTWATDTMDMRCTSIHDEQCCQAFANEDFFAAAHPIPKKSDCHEALDDFVKEHGAMDLLVSDGAAEQCGAHTEFQRKVRRNRTEHKRSEKERHNQNPAEGVIREIRKRWHQMTFKTNCP
jgi:hypothetical protein